MLIFINYLLCIFISILCLLILYMKWSHTYWKRQGVAYIQPEFLFGNVKSSLTRKKAFFDVVIDIYNKFKDQEAQYGGIYFLTKPILVILDTELIKDILVRDFEYFTSHGTYSNEVLEPLTGNLFNLEGSKWKDLRAKLTPTFTSSQMKMMFQTLAKCAPELINILEGHARNANVVNIKDTLSRFTLDVIGNCAFGIECNTMRDPNSDFGIYSKKLFERNPKAILKRAMSQLLPKWLMKFLGIKIQNQEVANFFMDVVKQNAMYRENNNVFRKDFFHLLLQLKNKGELTDDGSIKAKAEQAKSILDINEIAAQCFVFFGAGFETSSTTMAFALYEIANNPDIQNKVRKEVVRIMEKYDGNLSYDAVMEMNYLEKVIFETLRKYPPAPVLPRKCTKTYQIPRSRTTVEKGITVYVPVCAIQMDPEYYPDPERFDPDRFSEEQKKSRPQCTWLPFGEGPRTCIGMRFGVIQTKVGLASIIKNFRLKINTKTITPLEMDPKSLVTSAKEGIWLDLEKIQDEGE